LRLATLQTDTQGDLADWIDSDTSEVAPDDDNGNGNNDGDYRHLESDYNEDVDADLFPRRSLGTIL